MMLQTFERFNAGGFPAEGRLNFFEAASPGALQKLLEEDRVALVALIGDSIVGVLCMSTSRHLKLMFVDAAHHRRGIASKLWVEAVRLCLAEDPSDAPFTLNATDYGVPAYERLGFRQSAERTQKNGMIFTPMSQAAQPLCS